MIRISIFTFFLLFTFFHVNGDEFSQGQIFEKKTDQVNYINPSQIFCSENGIFVFINGQLIQVDALFSDSFGIYLKFPSGKRDWQCPRCNFTNDKSAIFCDNCLWDSRKDPIWDPDWN